MTAPKAPLEDFLLSIANAMKFPDFRAEIEDLLHGYRTRCLKWLLAEEEQPKP